MSNTSETNLKDFTTTSEILDDGDVFQGDKTNPDSMPERESELNKIHSAIEPAVRGENPRNIFLYGKPGQGKTAAVHLKRKQLLGFADAKGIDVNIVYIECNSANKSYHVLTRAIQQLKGLDERPRGLSLDDLYTELFEYMNTNGGTYIYILDEIDRIQHTDDEDELNILYKLPRAYSSEELRDDVGCSVIGISNDRRFKSDLSARIKDALYETEVDFAPYNKEPLVTILYRRASKGLKNTEMVRDGDEIVGIESDVVSEDVIEMCAEHAERERGSARQAIDLLGQAATIAHDERSPTVDVEHVQQAEREVNKNFIKNMLDGHTYDDLLALCGVMNCKVNNEIPAGTNQIYQYYTSYARYLNETPLVQRRMRDRLQDLHLTGVISMKKVTGGSPGGERWEYELTVPIDETVEILHSDDEYKEKFEDIAEEIKYKL